MACASLRLTNFDPRSSRPLNNMFAEYSSLLWNETSAPRRPCAASRNPHGGMKMHAGEKRRLVIALFRILPFTQHFPRIECWLLGWLRRRRLGRRFGLQCGVFFPGLFCHGWRFSYPTVSRSLPWECTARHLAFCNMERCLGLGK